jgi:hypothetical protein
MRGIGKLNFKDNMSIFNSKITPTALPAVTSATSITGTTAWGGGYTNVTSNINSAINNVYYGGAVANGAGGAGQYVMSTGSSTTWTLPNHQVSPLVIHGIGNTELVRLNHDGTVTWADTINIDEAVNAFGQVLTLGAENSAGLTYAVKQRMRDTVFEEIILMAKDKGSLTADDLTYLHQAAKIIDKLKGKE